MNPIPRAVEVSATPKPIRSNNTVFLSRRCRIVKLTSTTSGQVLVTYGDLGKALNLTGTEVAYVRVDGFRIWNTSPPGGNSNFVKVQVDPSLVLTTGITADNTCGPYEDYGGGARIAKVGANLPDLLLTTVSLNNATATTAFTVNTDPTARTSGLSVQTIVMDVLVRVQY